MQRPESLLLESQSYLPTSGNAGKGISLASAVHSKHMPYYAWSGEKECEQGGELAGNSPSISIASLGGVQESPSNLSMSGGRAVSERSTENRPSSVTASLTCLPVQERGEHLQLFSEYKVRQQPCS
jgi:hypothetical protein